MDKVAQDFIDRQIPRLSQQFPLRKAIGFGSRFSGTPHAYSDLDLVLVSPAFENINFANRPFAVWKAIKPDIHLDVFCYTEDEYQELAKTSPFLQMINKIGRQLL